MLIRFAEVYENSEVLSPIDQETWRVIGEISKLGPGSNVIELGSGKGAFAMYLAQTYGCRVNGFDGNLEFVDYAYRRARELGLENVNFYKTDVNRLEVSPNAYDLGACLGAFYIFRDAGWKLLMRTVKPNGYLAISDMYCKKVPAPQEVMDVFFEEEGQPLTLEGARLWYTSRGVKILREEECSRKAWLDYYDLTKKTLPSLARKYQSDEERLAEIDEAFWEDRLIREFGEEYIGYVTFIMQKS